MNRTVLHIDANNFYASVEELHHPELRGRPMIVCGDPELRHGIVLSKNYPAKAFGIKTAETIWQAKKKCPDLMMVVADYHKYEEASAKMREIFGQYTDRIEPYGSDEAYLDVSESTSLRGDGVTIADAIRERVKRQLHITCSAGVADNKPFAKLGSDLKKPDATTMIDHQNYRQKVWPLPADQLLFVGRSTRQKLWPHGLNTIGDIATADRTVLRTLFGKHGDTLWLYANGLDRSPVTRMEDSQVVHSVGNSTTTSADLLDEEDVKRTLYALVESVAHRLRKHGLLCRTVHVRAVDNTFVSYGRQGTLSRPTQLSDSIMALALSVFRACYTWERPIRNLGVTTSSLTPADAERQLSFLPEEVLEERSLRLELAKDAIHGKYGLESLQRACQLTGPATHLGDNHLMFPTSHTT